MGLGGSWGSISLGRQSSIANKTAFDFDPFGFRYVGLINVASSTAGPVRFNNDIQYNGTFGPWTASLEYALGEQAGSVSNGSVAAAGLVYASGPLSIGGAYTAQKTNAGSAAAPSFQDRNQFLVGASYKIGKTRFAAGYLDDEIPTAAGELRIKSAWGGASHGITQNITLTGGYYQTKSSSSAGDGKKSVLIAGATYALSKRTYLYAEIDSAKYDGLYEGVHAAPAGQTRQSGMSLGVSHSF